MDVTLICARGGRAADIISAYLRDGWQPRTRGGGVVLRRGCVWVELRTVEKERRTVAEERERRERGKLPRKRA